MTTWRTARLLNLDIDIFLTLNASNEVVYGKYIDRNTEIEAPLPFDIQTLLKSYPVILSHSDLHSGHQGIAFVPNHPMLIASRPILTSMKEGPASGTLIWIRLLDAKKLEEFSQLAERDLSILLTNSLPGATPDLPPPDVLKDQIFVHPQNSQTIVGFKYLNDLNGQPGSSCKLKTHGIFTARTLDRNHFFRDHLVYRVTSVQWFLSFHAHAPKNAPVQPHVFRAFSDNRSPIE